MTLGIFRRIGEALTSDEDAYWQVPSDTYIPTGPILEHSLFDDPERLEETWRRMRERREREAKLTPQQQTDIIRQVVALGIEMGLYTEPHPDDIRLMNPSPDQV